MSLTRKQRQNLQYKEEILAIAADLFARKGFQAVTMREIAKQAEFSIGTLYNLFKNKDNLIAELMREPVRMIQNEFMKILDSDLDETRKIADFILCHNRLSIEYKQGFKLYFSSLHSEYARRISIVKEIEQLRTDIRVKLTSVFRTGIQKGVFRNLRPELMTMALRASLLELNTMMFDGCDEEELMQYALQLKDIYLNGVLQPA